MSAKHRIGRFQILKRRTLVVLVLLGALLIPYQAATAIDIGQNDFRRTWTRTDQPVASQQVSRTWMWGPAPFTGPMTEAMVEGPGGGRIVQYFDKSRMEISIDPNVDPNSVWQVTNGLLATELVTGQLQLGLNSFEDRTPANINAAGDQGDPNGPTYASFSGLLGEPAVEVGTQLTRRIARDGQVTDDPGLAGHGVQAAYFVPETNHTVAGPFWDFMTSSGTVNVDGSLVDDQLFIDPFYATGFPITEAYWATVLVNGTPNDVLIQVFQRRVLTYTPANQAGWQVEAGNVGRHYFEWRYGIPAPAEPPVVDAPDPLGASPLPVFAERGQQVRLVFANAAPQPLTIQIDGPVSRTIELGACPDCQVTVSPPSECPTSATRDAVDIPAGNYRIIATRPGADPPPLGGIWTLLPNAGYGACFYVVE